MFCITFLHFTDESRHSDNLCSFISIIYHNVFTSFYVLIRSYFIELSWVMSHENKRTYESKKL